MPVGGGDPIRWVQPSDGGAPYQLTTFTKPRSSGVQRGGVIRMGIRTYADALGTNLSDGKRISGFAWSPDGKQLALAGAVTTSDIVLLKGVR
jgi:hypothetical protein